MKIAYFDCFSGISGDMTLGALLACDGADEARFREQLAALNVPGYELSIAQVKREGITAIDVDVRLLDVDQGHGRHLSDIAAILDASALSARVKAQSLAVFTRLADAEAKIHGTSREEIHFHEVGAVDAIVDIVGSCILLEMLGIEQIAASALPCGYGTVRCQHGIMPLPAPATVELLRGFPVYSLDIQGELVTPTGAALVAALADPTKAGRLPAMTVLSSGYGAGKKQFAPDRPNLLRVILGETAAPKSSEVDATPQTVAILETNLDDQSPETFDLLMQRCFDAGALDVFLTPVHMKKNRPATLVTVLCEPQQAERLAEIVFRETGTFGIRQREQNRVTLERTWQTVATPFGEVRLKIGRWQGSVLSVAPEYEDCKRAALARDVPLTQVFQAALAALPPDISFGATAA